jgi:hypothetical protein
LIIEQTGSQEICSQLPHKRSLKEGLGFVLPAIPRLKNPNILPKIFLPAFPHVINLYFNQWKILNYE